MARFVEFQARNNVTYTEVRYDPVRIATSPFASTHMTPAEAVGHVQTGLLRGMARWPHTEVHQLLCAMRSGNFFLC